MRGCLLNTYLAKILFRKHCDHFKALDVKAQLDSL